MKKKGANSDVPSSGGQGSEGKRSNSRSNRSTSASRKSKGNATKGTGQQSQSDSSLEVVDAMRQFNLSVLKRMDSSVNDIVGHAAHVVCYRYEDGGWQRREIAGSLFVVKRKRKPTYRLVVLNRHSTENLVLDLTSDVNFEFSSPYIFYSSPNLSDVDGLWFYDLADCSTFSACIEKIRPFMNDPSENEPEPSRSRASSKSSKAPKSNMDDGGNSGKAVESPQPAAGDTGIDLSELTSQDATVELKKLLQVGIGGPVPAVAAGGTGNASDPPAGTSAAPDGSFDFSGFVNNLRQSVPPQNALGMDTQASPPVAAAAQGTSPQVSAVPGAPPNFYSPPPPLHPRDFVRNSLLMIANNEHLLDRVTGEYIATGGIINLNAHVGPLPFPPMFHPPPMLPTHIPAPHVPHHPHGGSAPAAHQQ